MEGVTPSICVDGPGDGDTWASFFVPFLAGVASASLFWFVMHTRKQLALIANGIHDEGLSWIEPWMLTMEEFRAKVGEFEEDLRSRIGELPNKFTTKRGHWPWETIRQKIVRSVSLRGVADFDDGDDDDDDDGDDVFAEDDKAGKGESSQAQEKGLCIGSIFGLDVGGTLAKLVYFEQRAPEYDPVTPRERHYSVAASAQTVIMARRSSETTTMGSRPSLMRTRSLSVACMASTLESERKSRRREMTQHGARHSVESQQDLQRLFELRQESLPDDLNEFNAALKASNRFGRTTATDGYDSSRMSKSKSMFDFSHLRDRAEALDRFYNFARRLDSYDEGVKDTKLSFFSRELGGDFHFIR